MRPRNPVLDVYLGRSLVGWLTRPGSGRVRFAYSDSARDESPGENLLSASLPVREEPYPNAVAKPFFEGLLPEGSIRERIANEFHVSYDNVHGLLERIGAECAGAVVVLPQGEPPPDPADAEFEWLTEAQVAEKIENLPTQPLGVIPDRVRLSLGGVQDKLVLVRSSTGRFANPLYGAPSTHIIKPGGTRFEGIVANEAFCMRVAQCSRLPVARTSVEHIGEHECLIVERFDRTFGSSNRIERVHQEDFCQALGVLPSAKYEADGGPSVSDLVSAVRGLSTRAAADVVTLIRSVIFNFLIGNSDAHAKNYALLYDPLTQARLAPLYDLVSTAVYDVEQGLAMSIGGESDPSAIGAPNWLQLAEDANIARRQLLVELGDLAERVERCARSVREQCLAEEWYHPVIDEIVGVIHTRAALLAASAA